MLGPRIVLKESATIKVQRLDRTIVAKDCGCALEYQKSMIY